MPMPAVGSGDSGTSTYVCVGRGLPSRGTAVDFSMEQGVGQANLSLVYDLFTLDVLLCGNAIVLYNVRSPATLAGRRPDAGA
ncbi:hypothetical protein EVAR_21330_1 [Eumeta japonica]|uniref:Uncharacterized protein n=1 Tax=Eumeta variegata TaxID=151549 RepID=A0A4C1ZS31_EUMVA|nr:hypothetical protein EVAR_21330_1 [Eumeta japonica]